MLESSSVLTEFQHFSDPALVESSTPVKETNENMLIFHALLSQSCRMQGSVSNPSADSILVDFLFSSAEELWNMEPPKVICGGLNNLNGVITGVGEVRNAL